MNCGGSKRFIPKFGTPNDYLPLKSQIPTTGQGDTLLVIKTNDQFRWLQRYGLVGHYPFILNLDWKLATVRPAYLTFFENPDKIDGTRVH